MAKPFKIGTSSNAQGANPQPVAPPPARMQDHALDSSDTLQQASKEDGVPDHDVGSAMKVGGDSDTAEFAPANPWPVAQDTRTEPGPVAKHSPFKLKG